MSDRQLAERGTGFAKAADLGVLLGEDDHASLRDLGRAAGPPRARCSRYSKTACAGIPERVFFIFASLRLASATNCARCASFAMRFLTLSGTLNETAMRTFSVSQMRYSNYG